MSADLLKVQDKSQFVKKDLVECEIPVYLEKNLGNYWNNWIIGIGGWAAYQRLMLFPKTS